MKLNPDALKRAWQARQPRERGLIIALALAVPLLLADTWVWNPWRLQSKTLELRAAHNAQALAQLQGAPAGPAAQVAQVAQVPQVASDAATSDQGPGALQQLAALRQQLVQLEQRTQATRQQVMSPEAMAGQLREVTDARGAVRVTGLRSLPVFAVAEATSGTNANTSANPHAASRLYRHAFELQVEGSYADIARYLDTLERSAPMLRWSAVELDASRHPAVAAKLEVFTLSPQASWIQL